MVFSHNSVEVPLRRPVVRGVRLLIFALICALFFARPAAAEIELFAGNPLFDSIRAQDIPTIESIAVRGGNLEILDAEKRTPIIYAAVVGNSDIVELLIKHRARIDHRDKSGNTALFYAAGSGSIDVMDVLLGNGANPDLENRQGLTPMINAAAMGRPAAVQLLLDRRADPRRRDYTGRTALMWAEWNRRNGVVRLLKDAGVRE